ncbi:MAG: hypothetical protein D6722_08600, partial [Bacteroidetes bacterium]
MVLDHATFVNPQTMLLVLISRAGGLLFMLAWVLTAWQCQAPAPAWSPPPTSDPPHTRPNLILLLADDMRWDQPSFTGRSQLQTPNLDRLAQGGVVFEQAYVTTSICSASRASIFSGQYGRRHQLWGFGQGFSTAQLTQTYPLQLKYAGYQIGFIGKYGVGNPALVAPSFDYWAGFGGQGSYYQTDANGQPLHLTRKIGQQMQEALDQFAQDDRPFCLSVSFKAPHVQDGAPPEPEKLFPADPAYASLYESEVWQKPPTADSAFFGHFSPEFVAGNEARKRYHTRFRTPERYDASREGYARLIHGLDVVVGELLDSLEAKGLAGETVIIFTSDNGFYLGEYGFAGKWYGSEASARVPMVLMDPRGGRPRGETRSGLALNIDLAPTLLDLAGVEAPGGMQGRSLLDLIDRAPDWRQAFFYEHLWPSGT